MGFFDIFGSSSKAVDTATEAVKSGLRGIDALVLTAEEKIVYSIKFAELALEKTKQAIGETTAQTMSRRYMAWFIVFNSGLMGWVYIISAIFSWSGVGEACMNMLNYWHFALGAVVAFYFTGALITKFKK